MAPFFFLIYFELIWFIHSFFIHLKIDWMPYFFDGMVETLPLISLHPLTDRRINTLSARMNTVSTAYQRRMNALSISYHGRRIHDPPFVLYRHYTVERKSRLPDLLSFPIFLRNITEKTRL